MNTLRSLFTSRKAGNVAVVAFLLVCAYLFVIREMRFFRIPSSSMEPTLLRADQIATLSEPAYRRGDIIVTKDNANGGFMVKRIVGLGGDAIAVRRGALFVNGEYASEPYILEPIGYEIPAPVIVPENHVFLLGDNRNNSSDSHDHLETFPEADIIGRVRFIYFPYDRWGVVRSYPLTNRHGQ